MDNALSDQAEQFYDWLAVHYDAVYADWEGSVRRQARALDRLIRDELGSGDHRVLDCTCGIGTQALGLAALGYSVTGTDVSAAAIDRARREAETRNLNLRFAVADLRNLSIAGGDPFDIVLSADNALPHLADERDLRLGLGRMLDHLRPGGLVVASIRDYDVILEQRPVATSPAPSGEPGRRRVTFQLWHWSPDGRTYELEFFVLRETPSGAWRAESRRARYRALPRAELTAVMEDVGFRSVRWMMPETSGFFQPVVTARRAD